LHRLALITLAFALAACAETPKKTAPPPPRPAPPQPGHLERRFDATRGMTLLRVRPKTPPPPGRSLALVAAGGFAGHTSRGYGNLVIGLRSAGPGFHLASCKTITLAIDDRNLGTFAATRQTEIGAGWLAEYILAAVPFTRAYALVTRSAGRPIEVRACEAHHRLDADEHDRLRQLVNALVPSRAP
ncbi:MAG: hypothetical protein KAI47_21660, partial [Deltaproteobacteria bacterium]|nr:hypothetical protein [Deltaproteobacteria bacterium]